MFNDASQLSPLGHALLVDVQSLLVTYVLLASFIHSIRGSLLNRYASRSIVGRWPILSLNLQSLIRLAFLKVACLIGVIRILS